MRRFLSRSCAVLLTSIVALGAVELFLRARATATAFRVWPPGLSVELEPDPEILHGIHGPSRFRVSSLGFRGDEDPGEGALALLALGGSTTECLYLDQAEAWPALLEDELARALGRKVWVANAGRSGRTTRDHACQLRHLLAQEPRFERVLLSTGVNDLCAWLAAGTSATAPAEDLARAFEVVPRTFAGGPWWQRTAVFELLRRVDARRSMALLAQDPRGSVYTTWRAHRAGAHDWVDELPDPAPALARFRSELTDLLASCERHGADLALVTQPSLWSASLAPEREARLWMGGIGDYQERPGCDYYTAAALARGLELFNGELRSFARAHALPLLDPANALSDEAECFYDDVHFNEEGARRVAHFLAVGLEELERN